MAPMPTPPHQPTGDRNDLSRAAELCYLAAVFAAVMAIWWAWKAQPVPAVVCGLNGINFAILALFNETARRRP